MTKVHRSIPQFGEDIPENLQLGVSQCFLKIKRCVTDIINLQKSDVGVLQEEKKHYIVFRTESLTKKILERRYFVEEAIEAANELSFKHPVVGKNDRHINYVLKVPTNK